MAGLVKKELINKRKAINKKDETERRAKPYNEEIKETVKETQTKATPTQILLGSEQSYLITTCIIHAHFINLAKPGSYGKELNRMLIANGLPPVIAPTDVPSEELFGAKMMEGVRGAMSKESITSVASGFQEEGFDEMLKILEERDPRRKQQRSMESVYYREKKERSMGRERN